MGTLKLGISYNVFDGFELLKDSILQIREFVDYISIVYQKKSNWGNDAHPLQKVILDELLESKLVDELKLYNPNNKLTPKQNEILKRNIGLEISKNGGCTHHMSMDCDEFYTKKQFGNYVKWIEENTDKAAYSELWNYMKYPNLRYGVINKTKVSLFAPIKPQTKFVHNFKIPYLVDPSRIMNNDNTHIFTEEFIVMHHMTTIRKDMVTKLNNASKKVNKSQKNLDDYLIMFNNLDIDDEETYKSFPSKLFKAEQLFDLDNFNKIIM